MNIAICDDEPIVLKQLDKIIRNILFTQNDTSEIISFTSGESLIKNIEEFDLVFLDIDMPGWDGIETGKQIRKINTSCKIVMATSMIERFKEAFYIDAFRFITKPFNPREIEEAIYACSVQQVGSSILCVYRDRIEHHFSQREIEYARAYNSYTEFLIKKRLYRSDCSLNKMEHLLDKRIFYRINKQYCVNMLRIENYMEGKIIIDGKEILVSRRKKKEFEQAFFEFGINYE